MRHDLIPGQGRSSGGGHGNPLQDSGLENPMDTGTWWASVHGVTKSWTQPRQLSTQHSHAAQNTATQTARTMDKQLGEAEMVPRISCVQIPDDPFLPLSQRFSTQCRSSVCKTSIRGGTSLVVQWLGPCTSTARGASSIPDWGTKILHAICPSPQKKQGGTYRSVYGHAKLLQSCLTLYGPMDCGPLGFSVHGILQARVLECVAMHSSRGSSRSRDGACISYFSCLGRQVLYRQCHLESPNIVIL